LYVTYDNAATKLLIKTLMSVPNTDILSVFALSMVVVTCNCKQLGTESNVYNIT